MEQVKEKINEDKTVVKDKKFKIFGFTIIQILAI